jgi:hypothetical protein
MGRKGWNDMTTWKEFKETMEAIEKVGVLE